ncbi:hypothetical protein [Sporosarcina sp. FSL K6-3457]|uniref:hypothetical protein n=1 Tax=Sporosarcina sp. FSL K6-3457 TaxID=2978204 RepID=UPI0030FA03A4
MFLAMQGRLFGFHEGRELVIDFSIIVYHWAFLLLSIGYAYVDKLNQKKEGDVSHPLLHL